MGIEPPGGGRGKSRRQGDKDPLLSGRSTPSGSTPAQSSTSAAPPGSRKRPASEMSAPAVTQGSAGSMLQYILHAFSACAVVVEERSADSQLLYSSIVAHTAKSARTAPEQAAAAAAAQAARVRASVIKSVAKAAGQLQATAQLLGQIMGTPVNLRAPTMPSDVAAYLAQLLDSRRTSAVPTGGPPQARPAGSYGLPLGHSAAGASSATLTFNSTSGVRVPSRVSSLGTPALPVPVDRASAPSLRSPGGFIAPTHSHTSNSHHPSRVSVATGYTSRVGAGGAGGGSDSHNALSQFATVAAEAWERESAASGLSSTPNNTSGGAAEGAATGRKSRRSLGAGSSSAGRASADAGAASGSAGRASAVLLRVGVGGHATPLSPSPADVPDGDSEVAAVSGLQQDVARRRRRRADSALDEGNVSDADSTRAAPAIAAPAIRSALDVSFAADDDDDRFDPFDFIDAADLSMRKAATAAKQAVRPPPIRAPQSVAERHAGGSPVMFGMVGAARFGAPLKGGMGGLEAAPSGMLPHQVSGPLAHSVGTLSSTQVPIDAGLVGAGAGALTRAGSALSSVGHSTTIGRLRHPLLVGGTVSIASSGGAPRGGVFPSPVPPPSRQRSNSNASSSLQGDLLLGGEVMGLRPLDSVSAAPSPAGREAASARAEGTSLGRGSEAASSPRKRGNAGGGSVEGPYGYSAWGSGTFGSAPPLTPLVLPSVGDSIVQGMLSANGSSTGGTSASAGGHRSAVPTIAVRPGGVVSMADGGFDDSMTGPGTGFTSAEADELPAMWPSSSADRGGAAQLHGDTVASREW